MGSLLAARYAMVADFYQQQTIQDESGQITRDWNRSNPFVVQNLSQAILVKGARGDAMTEKWTEIYEPYTNIKMFIATNKLDSSLLGPIGGAVVGDSFDPEVITRRFRVGNIRERATGQVLWLSDRESPMEFNILGVTPVTDPFGRVVEFELLLKEVVDQ
jgi:hypothetical protein